MTEGYIPPIPPRRKKMTDKKSDLSSRPAIRLAVVHEVIDAYIQQIITKDEARKLFGFEPSPPRVN
jgi:hypothetical protein